MGCKVGLKVGRKEVNKYFGNVELKGYENYGATNT